MANTVTPQSSPIDVLRWAYSNESASQESADPSTLFSALIRIQSDTGLLTALAPNRFNASPQSIKAIQTISLLYHNAVRTQGIDQNSRKFLLKVGDSLRAWSHFDELSSNMRKEIVTNHRLSMETHEWLLDIVKSFFKEAWAMIWQTRYTLDLNDRSALLNVFQTFEYNLTNLIRSWKTTEQSTPSVAQKSFEMYIRTIGEKFSSKGFSTILKLLLSSAPNTLQQLNGLLESSISSCQSLQPASIQPKEISDFHKFQRKMLQQLQTIQNAIR
jgi:hypothetical protein